MAATVAKGEDCRGAPKQKQPGTNLCKQGCFVEMILDSQQRTDGPVTCMEQLQRVCALVRSVGVGIRLISLKFLETEVRFPKSGF